MTPDAERFVAPETFARSRGGLPGVDVYLHLHAPALLVVAPCTASTLAKLAHGLADNVVTQSGARGVVPDRRRARDERADVGAFRDSREVATLHERGVVLVGPDDGAPAEGELGDGRMATRTKSSARPGTFSWAPVRCAESVS